MIGGNSATDTTPGILALGNANKGIILPSMAFHNDIINPGAGMMVFVTPTSQLAVYNGRKGSPWRNRDTVKSFCNPYRL